MALYWMPGVRSGRDVPGGCNFCAYLVVFIERKCTIYRQLRPVPSLVPHVAADVAQARRGLLVAKLYYFCFFGAIGCLVPFLNVYLAEQGLNGAQIGWLGSMAPLIALTANPFWGAVADRWQAHRSVLALCAWMAGVISLLFLTVRSFWPLMALVIVLSFFRTPIASLIDSTVMDLVRRTGAHYGRQRTWGSVGFVGATFGLGQLLSLDNLDLAFWLHGLLLAVACTLLSFLMPIQGQEGKVSVLAGLRHLARSRGYLSFLGAMALLGIGTSSYVNFMGLHLLGLGGDERLLGLAWALNGLAEAPIMFLGGRWFARFQYGRLIQAGLMGYGLVWILLALATTPSQLMVGAFLSGLCYGTFWVAAVSYASEAAPPGLSATAQALVGAAQAGVGWSLGAVVAGYLWDAAGGAGVFAAAAVASVLASLLFAWGERQGRGMDLSR